MTRLGYTLMTEQSGPKDLVRYAVSAEHAGFDFEVSSDHFSPWLVSQGHAPNAWTMLGAVAHATERVDLYTYVTCPTMRYHPAVVAQQAATLQILADGRFTLGLGSGENLNEHVVGRGWPTVQRRHDMLCEAIVIIRELFSGELVDHKGEYFEVDSARIWDRPDSPAPPSSSLPRRWPRAFRADPTSMRSSRRSAPTGRPDSPISPWCRSATTARTGFSRKPPGHCWPSCATRRTDDGSLSSPSRADDRAREVETGAAGLSRRP